MAKTLTIVQMNDTHASLFEHGDTRYAPEGFKVETLGGYPRIMTKVKEYRAQYPGEVLLLDNGDTLHGTYEAVQSKGEVMIPYLKALGVDAMTFHWDAAYTPKHLKGLEAKLGYPILAVNVYHRDTRDLYFEPTAILERNGLRIGIVGVASNIIQKNMPPRFWEGADFTDGIEETREHVKRLRKEGVDLVVVLSHLGYPQDIALLEQVEGIDLCLSGHTHNRVRSPKKVGEAYIIQSGALASAIGFLRLTVQRGKITDIQHEYVLLDRSVKQDRAMLKMLREDEALNAYKAHLDLPVGRSRIDLHRASSFYGTMDYLLLDAMREATGLPIAFSNGWRYGGAIRKGPLTRRDLYRIVPMDPVLQTAELTGEEMVQMLEDNLESTFSTQPFKQMGGYIKRNAGLRIYFKLENPYAQRIQRVFVGKEEVDPAKVYQVVYVTQQAVPQKVGRKHKSLNIHAVEAMEQLLRKGPYDRKDLEGYMPV